MARMDGLVELNPELRYCEARDALGDEDDIVMTSVRLATYLQALFERTRGLKSLKLELMERCPIDTVDTYRFDTLGHIKEDALHFPELESLTLTGMFTESGILRLLLPNASTLRKLHLVECTILPGLGSWTTVFRELNPPTFSLQDIYFSELVLFSNIRVEASSDYHAQAIRDWVLVGKTFHGEMPPLNPWDFEPIARLHGDVRPLLTEGTAARGVNSCFDRSAFECNVSFNGWLNLRLSSN